MASRQERREVQDAQRQQKATARMDPSRAATVLLVRHGQTDWNVNRRLQGHLDIPLNEEGVRQAEELAVALEPVAFTAIYSSDLSRAVKTAEAIAARRPEPTKVTTSPNLRERALGVVEGLTPAEAAQGVPEAFRLLASDNDDAVVPGGESPRQLRTRVAAEVGRIAAMHPGETVLIVAHGGPLHSCYRHAVGHAYHGAVANASVHKLLVEGRVWAVLQWNAHAGKLVHGNAFGGGAHEG
ncbi:hypothetical protein HYH03_013651 [Edaphochlamys debaryana]|uniref:Phosphoglycerate mutase n=1 Tax=Edaphochlamys debaryana TaxID=47281 RepID=A0A835XQQ0_9CHLO|nr:hypothetical protein HYH03_013651 [Edaphochlamys debaryana]|eukprot:KAG2487807.1 hypothetical protein HYH03_013651 [Edaphochlamys debaryana]